MLSVGLGLLAIGIGLFVWGTHVNQRRDADPSRDGLKRIALGMLILVLGGINSMIGALMWILKVTTLP
jgi:hypothetical protein